MIPETTQGRGGSHGEYPGFSRIRSPGPLLPGAGGGWASSTLLEAVQTGQVPVPPLCSRGAWRSWRGKAGRSPGCSADVRSEIMTRESLLRRLVMVEYDGPDWQAELRQQEAGEGHAGPWPGVNASGAASGRVSPQQEGLAVAGTASTAWGHVAELPDLPQAEGALGAVALQGETVVGESAQNRRLRPAPCPCPNPSQSQPWVVFGMQVPDFPGHLQNGGCSGN